MPLSPARPAARLAIGTVQFGLPYGVTNNAGQVPASEVALILSAAAEAGIDTLDTAAAYGDSETVLGRQDIAEWHIFTKTPPFMAGVVPEDAARLLIQTLRQSLQRLGRSKLDGLMVHHGQNLLQPAGPAVWRAMQEARDAGLVERIGASVYDPDELEVIADRYHPDLVQLPLNLLDQRFLAGDLLPRLKAAGCEIHTRSLFLQGLLLAETVPPALQQATSALERYAAWLREMGLSRLQACLAFGLAQPLVDRLVVGTTSATELAAIIAAANSLPATSPDFASLAVSDPAIINPSKWPRTT